MSLPQETHADAPQGAATPAVTVTGAWAGYVVDGTDISIRLVPMSNGLISVSVIAHPALTGFRESCSLGGSDAAHYFGLCGITISPSRLDCMAASDCAPIYREGFSVVLELGMADAMRPMLEPLARVAVVSAAIARRVDAIKLARDADRGTYAHMHDFGANVVARIVLDGVTPERAIEREAEVHFAGKNEEFMADFADDQVQHLLATAALPGQ